MKKKLFVVMILFALVAISVSAASKQEGVWDLSGLTTGSNIGSGITMQVSLDLREKRASEYGVGFTKNAISEYSDEITNVEDIKLTPNAGTMKFEDYGGKDGGDNSLYISYKFKENTDVSLYLYLDSGLKAAGDDSINLKYKVTFNYGSSDKVLESGNDQTYVEVKRFEDKAVVGATEVGSFPLTISAVDTFEQAATKKLSSTMKLIVRSEA